MTRVPNGAAVPRNDKDIAKILGGGTSVGDCGYATLYTFAPSADIEIYLNSTLGPITGGWWSAVTDGLFSLSISGGIPYTGTSWWDDRFHFADPGLWPAWASTAGLVNTTAATCVFSVSAPGS
jgi:hypothetical protein